MSEIEHIKRLLSTCPPEFRRAIFEHLRSEFAIHPIETSLNVRAEVILEAIARASDLTLRGIRGVIAEAAFETHVASRLQGWMNLPVIGNNPYDFLLEDSTGQVRVQVKMQRLKNHKPMMANQALRSLPTEMYVVETQRTRGGKAPKTGEDTRPYKYGEFDILAVSLHPSTNDWTRFMYTVASWLLPRTEGEQLLLKFQPVAPAPCNTWTNDFTTCVKWLRSGTQCRIL